MRDRPSPASGLGLPPFNPLSLPGCFLRERLGFRMDGYTFYTLPSSANGRHFSPATLPSDEAAIARATGALRDCPVTQEVAIWTGSRFVARVAKDRD